MKLTCPIPLTSIRALETCSTDASARNLLDNLPLVKCSAKLKTIGRSRDGGQSRRSRTSRSVRCTSGPAEEHNEGLTVLGFPTAETR